MADLYSDGSRWLYGIVITSVVVPIAGWLKKNREDKNKLVTKVDKLEEKVNAVSQKLDVETGERRLMETQLNRMDEKFDTKMDKMSEVLVQISINTAINSEKIK